MKILTNVALVSAHLRDGIVSALRAVEQYLASIEFPGVGGVQVLELSVQDFTHEGQGFFRLNSNVARKSDFDFVDGVIAQAVRCQMADGLFVPPGTFLGAEEFMQKGVYDSDRDGKVSAAAFADSSQVSSVATVADNIRYVRPVDGELRTIPGLYMEGVKNALNIPPGREEYLGQAAFGGVKLDLYENTQSPWDNATCDCMPGAVMLHVRRNAQTNALELWVYFGDTQSDCKLA